MSTMRHDGVCAVSASYVTREDVRRMNALARWEDDGGAAPGGPALGDAPIQSAAIVMTDSTEADSIALRIEVAALEHLVIALLAAGNEGQKSIGPAIANHAAPRNVLPHPLTVDIVAHVGELVSRADTLRRLHEGTCE